MRKNGKLRWAIVIVLGLVVLTVAGAGVVAFQPRTANHFGYALPGQDGLPYRISYQGRSYINLSICAGADWCKGQSSGQSLCVTQQVLVQDNRWPLVQVGSVPTFFGASHPVMAESASNDLTQLELFVVNGNDCYVAYALQGSPWHSMRFRVGVFATIRDERGGVLLCHRRDADFWNQPGGGLESGETPWEGAVREVREEVGLEVAVERLAGVYSRPALGEIIFSFVCRPIGGTHTTSDEADRVGYFLLDALPPNTFAEHIERIRDACADHDHVVLRVPNAPSAADAIQQSKR